MAISQSFSEMRQRNSDDIVRLIKTNSGMSRAQVAKEAGLAKATVSAIVEELLKKQLLQEIGSQASSGGRPAVGLAVNPNYGYTLGISLDFNEITACIIDLDGSIKHEWQIQIEKTWGAKRLYDFFSEKLKLVLASSALSQSHLLCTGIAIPGPIEEEWSDSKDDDLKEFKEFIQIYRSSTISPVFSETNTNMSALAETKDLVLFHSGTILVVRIGHHIRSALLQGVHLLTDAGGDFGHIKVSNSSETCHCGAVGCLNTIASTEAMLSRARKSGVNAKKIKDLALTAKNSNSNLQSVFDDAGNALGEALANCINLIGPQLVVITGRGQDAGDLLVTPIVKKIDQMALSRNRAKCRILLGSSKTSSECYGAALSASRKVRACPVLL